MVSKFNQAIKALFGGWPKDSTDQEHEAAIWPLTLKQLGAAEGIDQAHFLPMSWGCHKQVAFVPLVLCWESLKVWITQVSPNFELFSIIYQP